MKRFVAVAVVLSVALAGCGKKAGEAVAERMIEAAMAKEGAKGKVDITDGKMTVQTKDGTAEFSAGGGAKVPDKFPKDVPVYDGAKVVTAISAPGGFSIMLETKDAADKVAELYKSKMTADGWKEEMNMDQGGQKMAAYKKGTRTATVLISSADKLTHINLTATDEKSDSAKAE